MKKYVTMAAGIAIIAAMFLPVSKVLGISISGMKMGGVAWFYMICGVALVAIALKGTRKAYIGAVVLGLIITLLDMKYQSDVKKVAYAEIGIGLWVLLIGALLAIVGGLLGLMQKNK